MKSLVTSKYGYDNGSLYALVCFTELIISAESAVLSRSLYLESFRGGVIVNPTHFVLDPRDEAALFFDLSTDLLAVLTLDGRFRRLNSAWERTLGSGGDCHRWSVSDFVHPDDQQTTISKLADAAQGAAAVTFRNRCCWKEGNYRWMQWTLTPFPMAQLIYASTRDITEQVITDEELHRSNEVLNAVLDAAPLAIWASDLQGGGQFWNPAAEEMLGWSEDDIRNGAAPAYFLPGGAVSDSEQDGSLSGVEIRASRKDGSAIDVRLWAVPLRDLNGVRCGTLGMIEDLTEEKRRDKQVRHAQRAEALSQLAGGIARDYSNLLTVIGGHTDLLIERCDANHPHLPSLMGIEKAVQQASLVTTQLTAFSRRHLVQPQRMNLNAVVNEMAAGLQRILGEGNVLRTALDSELKFVNADPAQLRQLVLNLLIGVREAASGQSRITIVTANEDRPESSQPARVLLTVSCTNPAPDPLPEQSLFEPFASSGRGTAAGLALFTAHEIVQLSAGEISVTREACETSFQVSLPAASLSSEPSSPPRTTQPKGQTSTILLAEDDRMVRRLVREVLERAGYSVLEAADGAEALAKAAHHPDPIDLLITDLVMPGMSGPELVRGLRHRPEMCVLYVSGYTDDVIASEGLLEPGAAFLPKPFTPEALLDKVEQALEGNRGLRLLLSSGSLNAKLAQSPA